MVEDRNACDVSEIRDSLITRGCKYQSRGNYRSKWARKNIGQVAGGKKAGKSQKEIRDLLPLPSVVPFSPDTDRHSNVISQIKALLLLLLRTSADPLRAISKQNSVSKRNEVIKIRKPSLSATDKRMEKSLGFFESSAESFQQ